MDAETATAMLALASAPSKHRKFLRSLSSLEQMLHHARLPDSNIVPAHVDRLLRWLAQPECHLIPIRDSRYPERLQHIHDPPLVLFARGDLGCLQGTCVAIVGSRNASPVGQHSADYFARGLARSGVIVSSGLAAGIDAAAHRAALAEGRTLAVLGTGPDIYYPPRNQQLQQQIMQAGLVISEFPPGMPGKRDHFPRRNRILSGLAQLVLVVEAKLRSGTLVTASLAQAQQRIVMAVPGSIWDPAHSGCFKLLSEGAGLAVSVSDILHELNLPDIPPSNDEQGQGQINSSRSLANRQLLANVGSEVTSIDTIVARSGLPVAIVTEQLVLLELEGSVTSIAGGYIKMGRR
ncbi:DNA-processing protein DprA [Pseudidiomarina gelatinasegens]|uniref:DNA-processing protein DprA n=1 Tax=Pseudidiomarina gelatinasegens TaxID=2487740 RepID=UPI003A96C734